MAPTLYMSPFSPPVRAVLMTAKSLGLELNLQEVDLYKREHTTPEYLKLNPQHTIPTLVDDDGFVIWDSHAIMPYLISKYGKDDSLYPKDSQKRAIVDQRLYFEASVVFMRLRRTVTPILFFGKKTIDQEDKDAVEEFYGLLETFLDGRQWVAGDSVTIADYSLIASITSIDILLKIDPVKYPRVIAWLKRAEALPAYEMNKPGLEELDRSLKSLLG